MNLPKMYEGDYVEQEVIGVTEIMDKVMKDLSENPNKKYYRRDIVTEKQNDTIAIGLSDIYYDFENDFRLQIDSVTNDSRCPYGAECIGAGHVDVRLDLIVGGNYHSQFTLNTTYKKETIIDGINYKLVQVSPHPVVNEKIDYPNYRIKIVIENHSGNLLQKRASNRQAAAR